MIGRCVARHNRLRAAFPNFIRNFVLAHHRCLKNKNSSALSLLETIPHRPDNFLKSMKVMHLIAAHVKLIVLAYVGKSQ